MIENGERAGLQSTRRSRPTLPVILFIAVGAVVGGVGCQKALYTKEDNRTQYDRYLRARNELAPPFIEDEYGRRRPNLRERLGPRG